MSIEHASIPGIDVTGALRRLRGNTKLYTRLLKVFFDGSELSALKDTMSSGDVAAATAAAHTMKGAAANLSLIDIQQKAFELEQLLKSENECINDKHRTTLAEIERLYADNSASCAQFF